MNVKDAELMTTMVDSTKVRQTVIQALVFKMECLDELLQMGCGNANTQRELNKINATLLWIESQQLELPF